jgi:hypothetical protein
LLAVGISKASFSDFEILEVCGGHAKREKRSFSLQYEESLHAPYQRFRFFTSMNSI